MEFNNHLSLYTILLIICKHHMLEFNGIIYVQILVHVSHNNM